MSNTDSTKVEFGKNAVLYKAEPDTNTGAEPTQGRFYYRIVKVPASQEVAFIYYNTNTQKRKNAYQLMNKKLSEG